MDSRCTREEALRILRVDLAPRHDPALPSTDVDKHVARLQTLSDGDLTVLAQSEETFALIESNRRLSNALRAEAATTTRLTRWLLGITIVLVTMTAWLIHITH